MKAMLAMLASTALLACDSGNAAYKGLPNSSIPAVLQRDMTEQQVTEVTRNRVPDRIAMTTCGTATQKPFDCKAYVYDRALRSGQYEPKLTVIFEKVSGQWKVSQWF